MLVIKTDLLFKWNVVLRVEYDRIHWVRLNFCKMGSLWGIESIVRTSSCWSSLLHNRYSTIMSGYQASYQYATQPIQIHICMVRTANLYNAIHSHRTQTTNALHSLYTPSTCPATGIFSATQSHKSQSTFTLYIQTTFALHSLHRHATFTTQTCYIHYTDMLHFVEHSLCSNSTSTLYWTPQH